MTCTRHLAPTIILIGALLWSAAAPAAPAMTPELLEHRNEAAGYAGTLKYMVGLSAKTCRDLLHHDDAYMNGIVDDWLARNGKFSSAAEQWMSFVVTNIANQQGPDKAIAARNAMLATVQGDATAGMNAILGDTPDKKESACGKYQDLVHSGRLDITPTTKLYADLVELENAVHGK